MIENLRLSLKEMITDLDWMGESTKTSAKEKVSQTLYQSAKRVFQSSFILQSSLLFIALT